MTPISSRLAPIKHEGPDAIRRLWGKTLASWKRGRSSLRG